MIFITREETRKRIKKILPRFDFSQPLTRGDWEVLRKVLGELERMGREKKHREKNLFKKTQLRAGDIVTLSNGEKREVKKVTADGHLILKGRKGTFHPCSVNRED